MAEVEVVQLEEAAAKLKDLSSEFRYATCFGTEQFTQGIVAISGKPLNSRLIVHDDKDVLCYVISGTGRLRIGEGEKVLKQGSIGHVPAGKQHDFQATGDRDLVLLYTLVEVRAAPA